jgi:hypothetical protein
MYNKESRRTKIVTFRVSQEEYHNLETACTAHHVRSISDLARDAVQQWIRGSGNGVGLSSAPFRPSVLLEAELGQVENRIQVLVQELERLQHLVQRERNWTAPKGRPALGGPDRP